MNKPALLALTCALVACQGEAPPPVATQAPDDSGLVRNAWALPTPIGAGQPDLAVGPDGRLLVSWVRKQGDRNALQYAAYMGDETWESAPKTIAVGRTLSANWANTPHIAMTADGALWAHWLQTPANAASPHASDILLTRSPDNGVHWSPPVAVNDDDTGTEHGFVSLWPAAHDAIGIAWLDGRRTAASPTTHATGDTPHAEHASTAAMTVRAARFDGALARSEETELDTATCDCCGTDVVASEGNATLAYRDRTEDEIRDIVVVQKTASGWSAPTPVHNDQWKMPACPLNGPAIASAGNAIAVAWYTAPNDKPVLRLARSNDGGKTFAAPTDIDTGNALQGRVDIAMDADATWLVWLREDAKAQTLELARFPAKGGKPQRTRLATLAGRGKATGFPKIAVRNGVAFVLWTDIVEGQPQLAALKVAPEAR